jgi:hypothetical protein
MSYPKSPVKPEPQPRGRGIKTSRRLWVAAMLAGAALALPSRSTLEAATPKQEHFASADAAVQAFVDALKANDTKKLVAILGPDSKPLFDSGDRVEDHATHDEFLDLYNQSHSLAMSGEDRAVLQAGKDNWPFPIPLVKDTDGWRFDTAAGDDEIINRRVGRNELSTIQACLAYVDAQREYYARNPDGAPLLHYAMKFASSPGKRDGLYWEPAPGEGDSPLGPLFAAARAKGYKNVGQGKPAPYNGYYFRILTAQGSQAVGGAYDYVVRGSMMGGFGLVAYPAVYDSSGVMTFVVNHDGTVFQKDLGPKTAEIAKAMKAFNPDSSWTRVENAGVGQT